MGRRPKVLYIGIDGCRPDALAAADTPRLDALIRTGAFSDAGLTCEHSNSGSCWSSLFTGVWEAKHGIVDNTCLGSRLDRYPTLFQRLRQADPSSGAAAIVNWKARHHPIMEGVDHYRKMPGDAAVLTVATRVLGEEGPGLLFVLFNDVDTAGHACGFDAGAPGYLAAIEGADERVGRLLDALHTRVQTHADEDWLIVVVTDHGGKGRRHGGGSEEERTVFMIFSAGHIAPQRIRGRPRVVDVPLTLLAHLGVEVAATDQLDGRALEL